MTKCVEKLCSHAKLDCLKLSATINMYAKKWAQACLKMQSSKYIQKSLT